MTKQLQKRFAAATVASFICLGWFQWTAPTTAEMHDVIEQHKAGVA